MPVVLIIADLPGKPQVALERGLVLADKLGAQVEVAAFCYESLAALGIKNKRKEEMAKKKLLARRKSELKTALSGIKPAGLKVLVDVIWEKDIRHWLDERCNHQPYAAVIKTGSRSGSFMYTSTDWHLLRKCPSPVMICAEKKWRRTKPIVAAVDLGSRLRLKQKLNRKVIETAKAWATALECELYVLNALHIPTVLADLDLVDEYSHTQKLRAEVQPNVEKLAAEYDIPLKNFRLKQGPVEKVITSEAARLKAQLLVMGTVGRRGVKAKLMGNTAEHVLENLRTDVLALRP
jgi:universal stress protein E